MTPPSRELTLVRMFARLTDTLVDDVDLIDTLQVLVENCAEAFGITVAGVLLADGAGQLEVAASTSEDNRAVEVLQVAADDGPGATTFRTGEAVLVPAIPVEASEWGPFTRMAEAKGYAAVFILPMRLRSETVGILILLRTTQGRLSDDDVEAAQAMADVATVGILHGRALRESDAVVRQLERALNSRVVIEQAKGVIAHTRSVSMDEAFRILRDHARSNRLSVSVVAAEIAERRLVL